MASRSTPVVADAAAATTASVSVRAAAGSGSSSSGSYGSSASASDGLYGTSMALSIWAAEAVLAEALVSSMSAEGLYASRSAGLVVCGCGLVA